MKLRAFFRQAGPVAALAVVSLAVAGCSNMGRQGALGGAIIGGAIGAVASGGKGKSVAAGAVAGALIGGILGDDADKRRREALQRDNEMQGMLARQSLSNNQLADANERLRGEIRYVEEEVRTLNARYRLSSAEENALRTRIAQAGQMARTIRSNAQYSVTNIERRLQLTSLTSNERQRYQEQLVLWRERIAYCDRILSMTG